MSRLDQGCPFGGPACRDCKGDCWLDGDDREAPEPDIDDDGEPIDYSTETEPIWQEADE